MNNKPTSGGFDGIIRANPASVGSVCQVNRGGGGAVCHVKCSTTNSSVVDENRRVSGRMDS
mgnify:CR=1 FL=1